jgi:hypothetical protein
MLGAIMGLLQPQTPKQQAETQEKLNRLLDAFLDLLEARIVKVLAKYNVMPVDADMYEEPELCGFEWGDPQAPDTIIHKCTLIAGHEHVGSPHAESQIVVTNYQP